MVVTHLFQVLAFVALEPPSCLNPSALVTEKVKVFESMRRLSPADVVRGQYEGYLDEHGVSSGSHTETFIAGQVMIETGGGRACRSSSGRASGLPRESAC